MAAVHRKPLSTARYNLRCMVSFLGWGSLFGLILPVLLCSVLALSALLPSSESEKLREAQHTAWVEGDWGQALLQYRALLEEHPGGKSAADAHEGVAQSLEALGLYGREVALAYESAERLASPSVGQGRLDMLAGAHWLDEREEALAEASFLRVMESGSAHAPEARFSLGQLKLSNGEVDEALSLFQELSLLPDPEHADLGRFGVSISYERLGNLDAAIAELDDEDGASDRLDRLFERRTAFSR